MADFPQHEIHFPGDAIAAAATAYAPWNVAPAHPQPEPLYYRVPVPGQPHGYAGVLVPDGMVSIGVEMISHPQGAHMRYAILVSAG